MIPTSGPWLSRLTAALTTLARALMPGAAAPAAVKPAALNAITWLLTTALKIRVLLTGPAKPARPRPEKPDSAPARPRRPASPRIFRLPRRAGWIARLLPDAAAHTAELQALLAGTECAAHLAANPARLKRLLAPLCRALGIPLPSAPATHPRRPLAARLSQAARRLLGGTSLSSPALLPTLAPFFAEPAETETIP